MFQCRALERPYDGGPPIAQSRLPPYLGMMMALGVFWLVAEICELGAAPWCEWGLLFWGFLALTHPKTINSLNLSLPPLHKKALTP